MKGLRTKFERFCLKHRNVGIPNLMLYVAIGNVVVQVLNWLVLDQLTSYLVFNRAAILQGQVWRLVTYIFTYEADFVLLTFLGLLCWWSLGRAMERVWGTLRFNLFYLTGILLTDAFCMIFGGVGSVNYLNMSLLLGFATLYPDMQLRLFYFIPVKAWLLALIYLGLTLRSVIFLALLAGFPHCLIPLVAIGNYFIFFGKDVINVLPPAWRGRRRPQPKVVDAQPVRRPSQAAKTEKGPYTHRCVVCGRTDVSNPELEFRYCSRCKGYFCYCEDHINNHNHVE